MGLSERLYDSLNRAEDEGLKEFVDSYSKKIFDFIVLILEDENISFELTQEIFGEAWLIKKQIAPNQVEPMIWLTAGSILRDWHCFQIECKERLKNKDTDEST